MFAVGLAVDLGRGINGNVHDDSKHNRIVLYLVQRIASEFQLDMRLYRGFPARLVSWEWDWERLDGNGRE